MIGNKMTTSNQNVPGPSSWALLFFLSLVWGGAFMSMAVALEEYGPLTVAASRICIGAMALLCAAAGTNPRDLIIRDTKALGFIWALGVVNFVLPFSLLAWGIQLVPSAFAGVAMGSSPLFVLFLAYIFVPDEQIGPRRLVGIILGFIGILVLVLPGASVGLGSSETIVPRIACVAAAFCYSVGAILIRRAPPIPPIVFTAGMLTAGSLVLIPVAILVEGVPEVTASRATWAVLYAGILPTGLAFVLRVVLIRFKGPIFMSLVAYIVPLWAVLLGVIFLGETPEPSTYIAAAIILFAVGLTQMRFLWPRQQVS
jgi:drug/metabolite transporter (DMT)-like permease